MNKKSFVWASVAVFVTFLVLEFVIHGVLLKNLYQETASLWRPEAEMKGMMWMLWIIYLISAPILTYIYSKGYEPVKNNIGQGFRFGLLMGFLISVGMSLGSYFSIPMPGKLAFYWFVAGMVEYILAGIVLGIIYKEEVKTVS